MDVPSPPTSKEPIIEEPEEETPEVNSTSEAEQPEMQQEEPLISLHALSGMSSPQTLKIQGYIKHHKVMVLIDSGSTHNFIQKLVNNFQILIACCLVASDKLPIDLFMTA